MNNLYTNGNKKIQSFFWPINKIWQDMYRTGYENQLTYPNTMQSEKDKQVNSEQKKHNQEWKRQTAIRLEKSRPATTRGWYRQNSLLGK